MGDELFLALYLIMKGCNGHYMQYLKNYDHQEQEYSVGDRGLCHLRQLKICKLANYDMVPTPEKIREIVAQCITANDSYAHTFIYNLKVHEKGDKCIPKERDYRGLLKAIRALPCACKGHSQELARRLYELLKMPASAVGACHSFHNNDVLMKVAMRQFGIGLLIVKDDNVEKDDWPYETVNYLDELGSTRVFLPLVFGMIYFPKDGNVSILTEVP